MYYLSTMKGRKPTVRYFHIFGSTCYILVDREYHKKWDTKSDRACHLFNKRTQTGKETINVVINDNEKILVDDHTMTKSSMTI